MGRKRALLSTHNCFILIAVISFNHNDGGKDDENRFEAWANGHADDDRKRKATTDVIKHWIFSVIVTLYSYTFIAIKTLLKFLQKIVITSVNSPITDSSFLLRFLKFLFYYYFQVYSTLVKYLYSL